MAPDILGTSPRIQESKLDLPEPTVPQTATLMPCCTLKFISFNVGLREDKSQEKFPSMISIAGIRTTSGNPLYNIRLQVIKTKE
jgi:hypothetical protein